MKIAITTPVFITNQEHKKYLDLTTRSIVSTDHDIYFIPVENKTEGFEPVSYVFDHDPEEIIRVKGRQPQGVSKAWNDGILKAKELGCEYVLVINSDIIFKSNAIDRLVAFAESHQEAVMWTMSAYADVAGIDDAPEDENFNEHPHFSCFMVKTAFLDEIGKFDENFLPAYMEDGDMHARIALANKKAYIYGGARFYHFGSRVIKSDQAAWQANTITFPKNQEYFLKKWGHPAVGDVEKMREVYFKHPYNEEDKPLNFWRNE